MSSKKENHPVEVKLSNNAYEVCDFEVETHQKGHDIKIYLINAEYETPEFIHITKGNRIIVIDYIIFVHVSSCGSTNIDFSMCNEYMVKTNCKTLAKFQQMLKLARKQITVNKNSEHPEVVLDQIIPKIKDLDITSIYQKHPSIQLKTFKQIKKHSLGNAEIELGT